MCNVLLQHSNHSAVAVNPMNRYLNVGISFELFLPDGFKSRSVTVVFYC